MIVIVPDELKQEAQIANNFLKAVKEKIVNNLIETSAKTLEAVNQEKTQAIATFEQASHQAYNTINSATATTKASLESTFQKSETLSIALVNSMQDAITSMIRDWINSHPVIVWLIGHPLLSLIILLFVVFTILGLLQALNNLVKNFWTFILKIPQKLFQILLFGFLVVTQKGVRFFINLLTGKKQTLHPNNDVPAIASARDTNAQQRVAQILQRLEVIREEQNQLSRELVELLDKKFPVK